MIAAIVLDYVNHKQWLYVLHEGKMTPQGFCAPGQCERELLGKGYHSLGVVPVAEGYDIALYAAPGKVIFADANLTYTEEQQIGDDRTYVKFVSKTFHGDEFRAEVFAVGRDEKLLPMPPGIKRFYDSRREADAVVVFLNLYLKGKAIRQVRNVFERLALDE